MLTILLSWSTFAMDEQELFAMSLEELTKVRVSVATRSELSVAQSPASISVFTRKQILELGYASLDQLLNLVPGFQVYRTDTDGANTPIVRGRNTNSSGRDILVLLDGVRLNDVVTGGVFSQEKSISLFNVAQVEIIRGPGSAIYGANAFTAVINIKTVDNLNEATISIGDFNHKSASLNASKQWEHLSLDISAEMYADDGDNYDAFYSFFGQFENTKDPKKRDLLSAKLTCKDFKIIVRRSEYRDDDFILSGSQSSDFQRHKATNRLIRSEYQLNHKTSDWTIYAEKSENTSDFLFALFPENPVPELTGAPLYWSGDYKGLMLGGNIRDVSHSRFGINGQIQLNDQHRLSVGFSRLLEDVGLNPFQTNINIPHLRDTGELIPNPNFEIARGFYLAGERADLFNPEQRYNSGVYMQDEWRYDEHISITLGARYDKYSDFGSNLSFRGGFVFEGDVNTFKLLYGEAFRAPSFIETRAGIASGGISNSDLKPELVKTSELTWLRNTPTYQSTLTLFSNDFDDYVQPILVDDVVPGFTALQAQNRGSEQINGVEFDLRFNLFDQGLLQVGGARYFNLIDNEPSFKQHLFLTFNIAKDRTNFNVSAKHHGQIEVNSPNTGRLKLQRSYTVIDANATYLVSNDLKLNLGIKNLLDKTFYTFSPQQGLEAGIPSRGRQITLGLNYNF